MSRFYIKSIGASGPKVEYSQVTFDEGVNILHGPSNSGKSYVINCINFMFGASEVPFTRESTGYNTIHMTLESLDARTVQMTRRIIDDKNGKKSDMGDNLVTVVSNFDEVGSYDYSILKLEYSDMLLKLMGIDERHQIISTQAFVQQNLTNRSFLHSYFIDEDNIYEKIPAFDIPRHSKITACLTALHFLFTGEDLHEIVPAESKKDRELKEAKKNAVIIYINEKIQDLSKKRGILEEELAKVEDTDVESKIEATLEEIESIEHQIYEATEQSHKLMEEIFTVNSKLEEATYLNERYKALRTQYNSDVKRLRFIIDGETKDSQRKKVVKCPFCDSSMQNKPEQRIAYAQASQVELNRITMQLGDLKEAEKDIQQEICALEAQLQELNRQNNEITQMISRVLKPKSAQLRVMMESYKRIVQIKQEMSAVDAMSVVLNADAFNREMEKEGEKVVFHPMEHIDMNWWKKWSDTFEMIVKECNYPNCVSARISPDTYDAIVNGKHKSDEGKGYRAFLNSIILFSLMKALEDGGIYRPAMLILDSPILTLKEKVRKNELADPGMRASLFKYMVENCGDNQIIIAENEIPNTVDYNTAHLIEFTQDETQGIYGFLKSVRNSVDS